MSDDKAQDSGMYNSWYVEEMRSNSRAIIAQLSEQIVLLNRDVAVLTSANEALKGEVTRQHGELRRVAEFANCMGNPVEYEDDTVYLKHLKASAHVYADLNVKYRERFDKIRVTLDCTCDSMGVCPNCIAREALALGAGVI